MWVRVGVVERGAGWWVGGALWLGVVVRGAEGVGEGGRRVGGVRGLGGASLRCHCARALRRLMG